MTNFSADIYFPAVICAEYDSPIDALIGARVPYDEAMDLVAAAWSKAEVSCIVATIDGGREVAVVRTRQGSWATCNAFLEHCCSTQNEAERRLQKLLKRGRRGLVGVLPHAI